MGNIQQNKAFFEILRENVFKINLDVNVPVKKLDKIVDVPSETSQKKTQYSSLPEGEFKLTPIKESHLSLYSSIFFSYIDAYRADKSSLKLFSVHSLCLLCRQYIPKGAEGNGC